MGDMMRPEIAQSPHPVSRLCVFAASKIYVAHAFLRQVRYTLHEQVKQEQENLPPIHLHRLASLHQTLNINIIYIDIKYVSACPHAIFCMQRLRKHVQTLSMCHCTRPFPLD